MNENFKLPTTYEEYMARDFIAVPDLIRAHSRQRPTHAALIQDERTVSYAELDQITARIAGAFARDGLKPCDAIAICAGTSIEYACVFLGALRAGLAVAPIAPSSTPESIAVMVRDSGATHLFVDASTAATLESVREQLPTKRIALDNSGVGESFERWAQSDTRAPEVQIQPEWPFNIIYSSGTTGAPKGIIQPHMQRWRHVQRAVGTRYNSDAVTLISTPLYSNTTLVSFFPTLGVGGTVVLMAKFDAANYLALAERHRVTHTMLVPVQYQRIMSHPDFDRYDLSSFRMKSCTSAPFSAALKGDILKRWPGGLTEAYGMTEGGGTCLLDAHLYPNKLHTVGQPAPGHDIRLIDDQGNEVPRGEAGEVVGHSAAMMEGYHNQPEKTKEAEWYDATGKRFIRTGDIGRFDEDGFLILMDRKKDMIISGGFNIYPSDLEAVVRQHPDVTDATVVGMPSQRWGETPVAFVVVKTGAGISATELQSWVNSRLGKIQRLAAVEFVDSLPRSGIGKVLKRELRDAYKSKLAALP